VPFASEEMRRGHPPRRGAARTAPVLHGQITPLGNGLLDGPECFGSS
jgi:hypothetical protein